MADSKVRSLSISTQATAIFTPGTSLANSPTQDRNPENPILQYLKNECTPPTQPTETSQSIKVIEQKRAVFYDQEWKRSLIEENNPEKARKALIRYLEIVESGQLGIYSDSNHFLILVLIWQLDEGSTSRIMQTGINMFNKEHLKAADHTFLELLTALLYIQYDTIPSTTFITPNAKKKPTHTVKESWSQKAGDIYRRTLQELNSTTKPDLYIDNRGYYLLALYNLWNDDDMEYRFYNSLLSPDWVPSILLATFVDRILALKASKA